jgi:hypothetical protein
VAEWHPILSTRETEPGRWYLIDTLGRPYGLVCFVRRGEELGYRADRTEQDGTVTDTIGYFRSLRAAAWAIHSAFLRSHGAPNRTSYSH